MPIPGSRWNLDRLRLLSGPVCQTADFVMLGGAVGVMILPSFAGNHASFAQFLELQVSLRNVFIAVMCLSTWRVILVSIGLYSNRARSVADYLFRWLIGVNSCAGVIGLIEVVLRPNRDVWHMIEVFWLVSVAATGLLRVALVMFDWRLLPILRRDRVKRSPASAQRIPRKER